MAPDILLSELAGPNGRGVESVCVGSGRFLRSVLVPFLSSGSRVAVFQTRGRTFLDSFARAGDEADGEIATAPRLRYTVDTIGFDGETVAEDVEIFGVGTLGTAEGRSGLLDGLVSEMRDVTVVGVGVTESGLWSADSQSMVDLARLLHGIFASSLRCSNPNGRFCVINTDNVPNNGDVIRSHVLKNAEKYAEEGGKEGFVDFLQTKVTFLNSMVDRITSSRPGSDGLVPSCEPLPKKALVVCDSGGDLPLWMCGEEVQRRFGVKIRRDPGDLASDIALKLRVANGTHTAIAHAMSLLSLTNTEALCGPSSSVDALLGYLDSLYRTQILPAAVHDGISTEETESTWDDWRMRLRHPHFGLSTFFITQNGAAKCGIRLGPTIRSLVAADLPLSVSMAMAVACILRFLTPRKKSSGTESEQRDRTNDVRRRRVHVGWLDADPKVDEDGNGLSPEDSSANTVTYADGLRYNLDQGWYEFACDCPVAWRGHEVALPEALSKLEGPRQPHVYEAVVRSYLLQPQGGNLGALLEGGSEDESFMARKLDTLVTTVSMLYARMVSGDGILHLLREMMNKEGNYVDGFATSCDCLG